MANPKRKASSAGNTQGHTSKNQHTKHITIIANFHPLLADFPTNNGLMGGVNHAS